MRRAPSKYRAVKTTLDGVVFASKKEAAEYAKLKLLQKARVIGHLELQPVYELHAPSGDVLGKYVADFRYIDAKDQPHVVDVKGFKTPLYRWKKKHAEAEHGITIEER